VENMDNVFKSMDKIFKIGILVLGVVFLVLFYFHGRYQFGSIDSHAVVVDTRTGVYYSSAPVGRYINMVDTVANPPTKKRSDAVEKGFRN